MDESEADILFQKQYLSIESSKAFLTCGNWMEGIPGVSVDGSKVHCPVLSLKVIHEEADVLRGRAEAEQYGGKSVTYTGMTHTGILMGQRYREAVDCILGWLKSSEEA